MFLSFLKNDENRSFLEERSCSDGAYLHVLNTVEGVHRNRRVLLHVYFNRVLHGHARSGWPREMSFSPLPSCKIRHIAQNGDKHPQKRPKTTKNDDFRCFRPFQKNTKNHRFFQNILEFCVSVWKYRDIDDVI